MKAQRGVSLALLVLAALQIAYFYPQLPDTVASRFDGAGRPNGWAPKGAFRFFRAFSLPPGVRS